MPNRSSEPVRYRVRSPWSIPDSSRPFRFGFLVVPDFTLIGLGSAIDPLRIANMVAQSVRFEYVTIAPKVGAVRSSDGVSVLADYSIANAPALDALLIVGPNPIPKRVDRSILNWLRRLDRNRIPLGGIDTGSYLLARIGLLDGYRCTIHWEDMDVLLENFPGLVVSQNLFEVDRNRCSCSGGIAALDMMIYLISLGYEGRKLAAAVSELLICERRGPDERQRIPFKSLGGPMNGKLIEAVTLMQSNIEEPLSMAEIATYVGLSPRHLERIFRESVNRKPSSFYVAMRLEKARHLVLKTERSISDIATTCGFVSLSHFISRYGAEFGLTPRVDRRNRSSEIRHASVN